MTEVIMAPKRKRLPDPRKFGVVPGTTIGLLSTPGKMPWYSWSIKAHVSCPGAVYGEGTICGSCYAQKGHYIKSTVHRAQMARFEWARKCMKSPEGQSEFIVTMVGAITAAHYATGGTYFRVHDSGDLFNRAYTECWALIARWLAPVGVKFWFPTRSYRLSWADALCQLATLPNVTVRPSALKFGDPAPVVPGLQAGSTAGKDFTCPASLQGNSCSDCRKCWTDKDAVVVFHAH